MNIDIDKIRSAITNVNSVHSKGNLLSSYMILDELDYAEMEMSLEEELNIDLGGAEMYEPHIMTNLVTIEDVQTYLEIYLTTRDSTDTITILNEQGKWKW